MTPYDPLLLPFQMGAFVTAANTGLPVVPVTIRGPRSLLRDGSWFPHRSAVTVVVGEMKYAEGSGWEDRLIREEILKWCGESDLSGEMVRPEDQ